MTWGGDPVLCSGTGHYAWEQHDHLAQQSSCGAKGTFTASLTHEKGTTTTYQIGGLLNIAGEAAEVSGSYSYSVSESRGTGTSQTVEFGAEGYEYLMIPVVLTFKVDKWITFTKGAPTSLWLLEWTQHLCRELDKMLGEKKTMTIEGDVVTLSYPKIGTTLSMLIVRRKCSTGPKQPHKKGPRRPRE